MDDPSPPPPHTVNPIVAFIIGLAIILLASILNAAGLNLTKLDHVRTSAIPKSARKKDWMRPLWLLGMLLYILSQLIGSTLALEYMRAEYVAPLGSTSLVFNFLFARFLVGTPVTSNDIYGTIIVILGVVGIVAFGSINSGLTSKTDVKHLTYLWRRPGWLGFFFAMSIALVCLLMFTSSLDAILVARSDLTAAPFASADLANARNSASDSNNRPIPGNSKNKFMNARFAGLVSFARTLARLWQAFMAWLMAWLEVWTAPQDDKQVAWTLGIGWACCGGGLAGGCLVFAKATVKLLSGSLSRQNPGNQFGHAASIFTIILLAFTAVLQIICLNRGLKVYDSTLVVPVFYGVYTATGFLDSLVFNDEVDAYQSWTLFLIFASILVLISGVVLLTHKKPEPAGPSPINALRRPIARQSRRSRKKNPAGQSTDGTEGGEQETLWAIGEDSDEDMIEVNDVDGDEDVDHHQHPIKLQHRPRGVNSGSRKGKGVPGHAVEDEEGIGLIRMEEGGDAEDAHDAHHPTAGASHSKASSDTSPTSDSDFKVPFRDNDDGEFGDWEGIPDNRTKRKP